MNIDSHYGIIYTTSRLAGMDQATQVRCNTGNIS